MQEKENIVLGESFERLLANVDYQKLKKFVESEIQTISSQLLQPKPENKSIEEWAIDNTNLQGQLVGLAMPDSYMESIVKLMRKLKEKKEKKLG